MFLALKELFHQKRKFSLIIVIVFLISYLVYFLTSLAYGLASSYTDGFSKFKADNIVLTLEANDNILMSMVSEEQYISVESEQKAKLGIFPGIAMKEGDLDTRVESYVFGIDFSSFISPTSEEIPANGVIISDKFLKEGYALNDRFVLTSSGLEVEIVGFTSKATYQTAPIIYMSLDNFMIHRYGSESVNIINAIVTKGAITGFDSTLIDYTFSETAKNMPGYTAQVLTFSIMIIFLIFITAMVLAIFIYVLTLQKISMFGVMKAQGISNAYIGKSVVYQTLTIVTLGFGAAFITTLLSGIFLINSSVPFAFNFVFYLVISAAFLLFAFLGALLSVSTVNKIDPLIALGG